MSPEIHRIHLEGPGMNALGSTMMRHVLSQLEAAGQAPVLLLGSERAFSAGLDLKEVASLDAAGMEAFLVLLETVVARLFNHPGPTVAAVTGHAIAGGCILARACDLTVGTTNPRARIGLNEVAIGLRFPPQTLAVIARKVPPQHHAEAILAGGLHAPAEALRMGLVDTLVDSVVEVAEARMAALAALPQESYQITKAALQAGVTDVSAEEARSFVEEVVPVWTSDRIKAKIRAVLER